MNRASGVPKKSARSSELTDLFMDKPLVATFGFWSLSPQPTAALKPGSRPAGDQASGPPRQKPTMAVLSSWLATSDRGGDVAQRLLAVHSGRNQSRSWARHARKDREITLGRKPVSDLADYGR